MGLPDPIPTIAAVSVNYDFARVSFGENQGVFATADAKNVLTVAHQSKARNRTTVRIDRNKVAADPFTSGLNQQYGWSVYTVFDWPKVGVSTTEVLDLSTLLTNFFGAGTPSYKQRVIQGEI